MSSWVFIYHSATRYAIIPQEILLRLSFKEDESEGELGKNGRQNNITQEPGIKIPKETNRFENLGTSGTVQYYSAF
jgi:hypothetical protein